MQQQQSFAASFFLSSGLLWIDGALPFLIRPTRAATSRPRLRRRLLRRRKRLLLLLPKLPGLKRRRHPPLLLLLLLLRRPRRSSLLPLRTLRPPPPPPPRLPSKSLPPQRPTPKLRRSLPPLQHLLRPRTRRPSSPSEWGSCLCHGHFPFAIGSHHSPAGRFKHFVGDKKEKTKKSDSVRSLELAPSFTTLLFWLD